MLHPKAPPACAGHWGAGGAGLPGDSGALGTDFGDGSCHHPLGSRAGLRGCAGMHRLLGTFPQFPGKWENGPSMARAGLEGPRAVGPWQPGSGLGPSSAPHSLVWGCDSSSGCKRSGVQLPDKPSFRNKPLIRGLHPCRLQTSPHCVARGMLLQPARVLPRVDFAAAVLRTVHPAWASALRGDVAQRESACFACKRPWVQPPASPRFSSLKSQLACGVEG